MSRGGGRGEGTDLRVLPDGREEELAAQCEGYEVVAVGGAVALVCGDPGVVVIQDLQNVELLVLGLVVGSVVCAAAERVVSSSVLISVL